MLNLCGWSCDLLRGGLVYKRGDFGACAPVPIHSQLRNISDRWLFFLSLKSGVLTLKNVTCVHRLRILTLYKCGSLHLTLNVLIIDKGKPKGKKKNCFQTSKTSTKSDETTVFYSETNGLYVFGYMRTNDSICIVQ